MRSQDLILATKGIADFVIERCVGKSGAVAEFVDLESSKCFGKALVSDLGDYVPFFFWLGKSTGETQYCDWAENQIRLATDFAMMPNGLFVFFNSDKTQPCFKTNLRIFEVYNQDDAILGLILMYELTNKERYLQLAQNFFYGISNSLSKEGFPYTHVVPPLKLRMPISFPNYSGLYIEELCRLATMTKKDDLLNIAMKIANAWIKSKYFDKYGLFSFQTLSSRISPVPQILNYVLNRKISLNFSLSYMMKHNTNMLFGLMELHSLTKDDKILGAIEKWMESLEKKMLNDRNLFYSLWNCETKKPENITLESNHAILDVLLEKYIRFKETRWLRLAEDCANSWLNLQRDSGLIPESPEEVRLLLRKTSIQKLPLHFSRLDSQVDFAVVLLKLYELTGRKEYYDSCFRIVEGVLTKHRFKNGFCEFVDVENGERYGTTIETKFLTLFIKLPLICYEHLQGRRIYQNPILASLIRDR